MTPCNEGESLNRNVWLWVEGVVGRHSCKLNSRMARAAAERWIVNSRN